MKINIYKIAAFGFGLYFLNEKRKAWKKEELYRKRDLILFIDNVKAEKNLFRKAEVSLDVGMTNGFDDPKEIKNIRVTVYGNKNGQPRAIANTSVANKALVGGRSVQKISNIQLSFRYKKSEVPITIVVTGVNDNKQLSDKEKLPLK